LGYVGKELLSFNAYRWWAACFIIETNYHAGEASSSKSDLLSNCEELIARKRMTIFKRSAITLVTSGILLVLILYLHPTRSQQPVAPLKPHKITINWEKVPHAVSYNVYRRFYRIETFTKVATANNNSYEDPGAQGGGRYCYAVTSIDSKGKESERSKEICLTVPLP
jgi:fibronectin type 3 domain-containing protein